MDDDQSKQQDGVKGYVPSQLPGSKTDGNKRGYVPGKMPVAPKPTGSSDAGTQNSPASGGQDGGEKES